MIPLVSINESSSLYLASVADWLCRPVCILPGRKPQDRFSRDVAQILVGHRNRYCNDPKFSDRQVWDNSVDPDQTTPRGTV